MEQLDSGGGQGLKLAAATDGLAVGAALAFDEFLFDELFDEGVVGMDDRRGRSRQPMEGPGTS